MAAFTRKVSSFRLTPTFHHIWGSSPKTPPQRHPSLDPARHRSLLLCNGIAQNDILVRRLQDNEHDRLPPIPAVDVAEDLPQKEPTPQAAARVVHVALGGTWVTRMSVAGARYRPTGPAGRSAGTGTPSCRAEGCRGCHNANFAATTAAAAGERDGCRSAIEIDDATPVQVFSSPLLDPFGVPTLVVRSVGRHLSSDQRGREVLVKTCVGQRCYSKQLAGSLVSPSPR